jgi:hypothetical protein
MHSWVVYGSGRWCCLVAKDFDAFANRGGFISLFLVIGIMLIGLFLFVPALQVILSAYNDGKDLSEATRLEQ